MPLRPSDPDRPAVLCQPRRLLRLIAALVALMVVIYLAAAATGFLHGQTRAPDPRAVGAEAPLERAMPPAPPA